MSLTCIIIDDEPNAVNLLEILVTQHTPWQLLAKCYNAPEALAFLKDHPVDFLFLDINMPQLSGMELAGLLPPATRIVFTTAYSEYAAESYAFATIDYLLKPITLRRFFTAVQKIESWFSQQSPGVQPLPASGEEYFFFKSGRMFRKILLGDILYFEGEKEYVRVITRGEQLLIYRRLKDIGEQLSLPFVRVHHSYIVNSAQLDKIQDNHVFIGGKQLPISEKFRDAFMEIIRKRSF
ncbi:MAG TPA: LytTR family DNA-binding domain-containing protein [Chitinophagaceae bacterium]|nr:LytTR family DNA-binding domain-containing protein [Chitinophagaceae bacterium]